MPTAERRIILAPACASFRATVVTFAILACTFAESGAQPSLVDAGRVIAPSAAERILPNDNRTPAGTSGDGTLTLHLVAREGRWFPQSDSGPSIVVQAFAVEGSAPRIPGPLVRVTAGTLVRLMVRNALDSTLVLFGMHEHPGRLTDSVTILPGATRELSFSAGAPGSYFYWGTTTGAKMEDRNGVDSQLSGAFIVDSSGGVAPRDRIFVLGAWNVPADTTKPKPWVPRDMMVINGKSWPHTERFYFTVGDTVHWRWLNPTADAHPMHLHGFYFGVNSRGSWAADTLYGPEERRLAVTEMMLPGGTMTLDWIPERAGNWLFHCHFGFHVSHYLSLNEVPNEHDPDSPAEVTHTAAGMAGLVLGLVVRDRAGAAMHAASTSAAPPHVTPREIRLFMQSARIASPSDTGPVLHRYAFVEQLGKSAPATDSVPLRSSSLVLRRGEPVRITVLNEMPYPSAVHWHGI